jgi:hypothetical protein
MRWQIHEGHRIFIGGSMNKKELQQNALQLEALTMYVENNRALLLNCNSEEISVHGCYDISVV